MLVLAIVVKHGIVLSKQSVLNHDLSGKKMWKYRVSGHNERGQC